MTVNPIRVLVVDDSRIFRSAIEVGIRQEPDCVIAGSVWSGEKALDFINEHPVDLVTLDVEMPGIGGLETLKKIRDRNATLPFHQRVQVLLVSAITKRGASITIEGLMNGAFDFICKPIDGTPDENMRAMQQQLASKIEVFRQRRGLVRPAEKLASVQPRQLTAVASTRFRAIAIGCSTGGPEALSVLLPQLVQVTSLPIFIVQHIAAGFTEHLCMMLERKSKRRVIEARDFDVVQPEAVYMAPPASIGHPQARNEVGNGSQRASARTWNATFRFSLFAVSGTCVSRSLLTMILTGMDCDGADALPMIKRSSGYVIAQDEASSVVWGMPGAAVRTGLVDQVVSLANMAQTVASVLESQ